MLCLSGFELYSCWVPLREVKNHTLFPSRPYKGVPTGPQAPGHRVDKGWAVKRALHSSFNV